MTLERSIKIDCPKCGINQTVTIWDSINVTEDPDLKEKLLKGEINIFRCQKCGDEAVIPMPLLYHDMEKRFFIQYYPFSWIESENFFEGFNKEGELDVKRLPRRLRNHFKKAQIVFDMEELLRYVIFRDRLNEKWADAS
jgi:predicted RNA-binding Zn-ribbon protein involved in translation (DUF1610 family)